MELVTVIGGKNNKNVALHILERGLLTANPGRLQEDTASDIVDLLKAQEDAKKSK